LIRGRISEVQSNSSWRVNTRRQPLMRLNKRLT